jgi:FixJ family two-component response regulator
LRRVRADAAVLISSAAPAADPENVSTPISRGPRLLLVDDDHSLRRALARTLRLEGFDVTGYGSVEELLAAGVPERDACLVLVLDVNLPGIDGISFKRTLVEAGRDLPTVFITALGPEDVSGPLAALAPVAVLFKPFKNEDLLAAIDRAEACFGPARTDGAKS